MGGVDRGYGGSLGGQPGPAGPELPLPSGVAFVEPLRGYEDHGIRATRALIAGARYRYPFIIDRGYASLLYLFPSVFIRQVDLAHGRIVAVNPGLVDA